MAQVTGRQASVAQVEPAATEDRLPLSTILLAKQSVPTNLRDSPYLGGKLLWHPGRPSLILVAAVSSTASRIIEYDAESGCQRAAVDCRLFPAAADLTPDGAYLVIFAKTNSVAVYSATTWALEAHFVLKSRKSDWTGVSMALASQAGRRRPLVYFVPSGGAGIRLLDTSAASSTGSGDEGPMVKLKSEWKSPILALGVAPGDGAPLLVVTADGQLTLGHVSRAEGTWALGYSLSLGGPIPAPVPGAPASSVTCARHPLRQGWALAAVITRGGAVAVEVQGLREAHVLAALPAPPGGKLAGAGFSEGGLVLAAAGRLPSGDATLRTLRLAPRADGSFRAVPAAVRPATLGEAVGVAVDAAQVVFDPASATLAALASSGGGVAGSFSTCDNEPRAPVVIPVVQMLDVAATPSSLGVPTALPLHSGLEYWTGPRDGDGTVSRLRFPRAVHVLSRGRVAAYDLSHGLVSDVLVLPPGASGTAYALVRAIRSAPKALWVVVASATPGVGAEAEGGKPGAAVPPARVWTAVQEAEAALAVDDRSRWFLPGRAAAFVGRGHDRLVVLSESGRSISIYDAVKLAESASTAPKPLYTVDLAGGMTVTDLFPGPPAHVAAPPEPRPAFDDGEVGGGGRRADDDNDDDEPLVASDDDSSDDDEGVALGGGASANQDKGLTREEKKRAEALRVWEMREWKRLEPPPAVLALATAGDLVLLAMPSAKPSKPLAPRARLPLAIAPGEAVVDIAWQSLAGDRVPGSHDVCHTGMLGANGGSGGTRGSSATIAAAACAALTTKRLVLFSERFVRLGEAALPQGPGTPASLLWAGPCPLVATTGGAVLAARWDGSVESVAASLEGPPPALLGALADRVLLARRAGVVGSRDSAGVEVASLALPLPELLVEGWAGLAEAGVLPGGSRRVRAALRTLAGSYDVGGLRAGTLRRLATAGFPEIAAALAARSEAPGVGPRFAAALAAQAGDWDGLIGLLMGEYAACSSFPGPARPGSRLAARLAMAGRACLRHGKFDDARRLLAAAGARTEALALAAFQGDWAGLSDQARSSGSPAVRGFADQLLAVNEDAFRGVAHRSAHGGRACAADWAVQLVRAGSGGGGGKGGKGAAHGDSSPTSTAAVPGLADSASEDDGDDAGRNAPFEIAPAGRLPFMEASVLVSGCEAAAPAATGAAATEAAPIAPLENGGLVNYAGLPGAVALRRAFGGSGASAALGSSGLHGPPSPSASEAALGRGGGEDGDASRRGGTTVVSISRTSDWGSESTVSAAAKPSPAAGATTPGARPVAEGSSSQQQPRQQQPEAEDEDSDDFFDSDDDQAFLAATLPPNQRAGFGAAAAVPPVLTPPPVSAAAATMAASPTTAPGAASSSSSPPALISTSPGAEATGDTPSRGGLTPSGGSASRRFRVSIRDEASSDSATPPSLRTAVQGLRLGPPPSPAGNQVGFGRTASSTSGTQPRRTASALSSDDPFAALARSESNVSAGSTNADPFAFLTTLSAAGPKAADPAPPAVAAGGTRGTATATAAPAAAGGSDLLAGWEDFESMWGPSTAGTGTTTTGIAPPPPPPSTKQPQPSTSAFLAGNWAAAMAEARSSVRPGDANGVARFVAATLLDDANKAGNPVEAARYARHAAAVPLEGADLVVVLWAAAKFQAAAKNYGIAVGLLTRLVTTAPSGGPGVDPQAVQTLLNDCDRHGDTDAAAPKGEDLSAFAAILASCSSVAEADELVENVVRAAAGGA